MLISSSCLWFFVLWLTGIYTTSVAYFTSKTLLSQPYYFSLKDFSIPFVTTCEWCPLLLSCHWLLDSIVMATGPGFAVTVTMAATLRQGEFSIALLPGFLTEFVPVVLNIWLLLQPTMVRLQQSKFKFKTQVIKSSIRNRQVCAMLFLSWTVHCFLVPSSKY